MSAGECQVWLTKFAQCVEKSGRSRVLIDSTTFRMSPANMDGPWRDAYITPRYNAAGVAKFAFHMPEGMPMIGKPPPPDGPGRFPTGGGGLPIIGMHRSEEHTSELQSPCNIVCRLL